MKRPIDPKETYIVTEMFGCGVGHAVKHFTHWESGEACPHGHDSGFTNEDYHLYWRMYLVPKHRGSEGNPYDTNSELYSELMDKPENHNKWGFFTLAPDGLKAGQVILPTAT